MKELNKTMVFKERAGVSMLNSGGESCGCSSYGCGCSKLYENISIVSVSDVYCDINDKDL